jgi:hypothetical protein
MLHHDIPPARAGRQDSEVPHQVGGRWGHQSGQAGHQIERVEDDMGGAVAPAVAEAVDDQAIGGLGEAVGGDRWASAVARETLQSAPVACGDADVRVEAEAVTPGP